MNRFRTAILAGIVVGLIGIFAWSTNRNVVTKPAASTSSSEIKVVEPSNSGAKVTVADPSKVYGTKWPGLSTDLQQAIMAIWQRDAPGCIENNDGPDHTEITYTVSENAARAAVGCDSPAIYLLVKTDGSWRDVEHTQMAFSCATFEQYDVPKELAECM